MVKETVGILVMAYGSPESVADVEAYYTHIRRGRRPSPEQVRELIARYEAIGGSPLNAITFEIARRLEARLASCGRVKAYVGMKHWHPFIDAAIRKMAEEGIRRAVALALAPQYSKMSVEGYLEAARSAAAKAGIELAEVRSWHLEPHYIEALADKVGEARARFPKDVAPVQVLFTAHSLPERILEWNDPYPVQLGETCRAVAAAARVEDWSFAYQSASSTGEPWLGPDLLDVLESLKGRGYEGVLVCPAGFVTDHLEILYDIDIEAKRKAAGLGLHLERTASLHTDERFIDALAAVVRAHGAHFFPTSSGRRE